MVSILKLIRSHVFFSDVNEVFKCYANRLKGVYSKRNMPVYFKGRQLKTKQFIELALVYREKMSKVEKKRLIENTILTGNIQSDDESQQIKTHLDTNRIGILESGALATCILLQGNSGVGKSTLVWNLCCKWESGEMFQEYSLVIFIPLCRKEIQEACQLKDLFVISNGPGDEETKSNISRELLNNEHKQGAERILLILDGYDELPEKVQNDSLISQIVAGELLPSVSVLVTSRPTCCDLLYDKFSCRTNESLQHIEVLGFTQNNIETYLEDNVDPDKLNEFWEYLFSHPKIKSMLYNPLQCALTVEACNEMFEEHSSLPNTQTKLYENNIIMTLARENKLDNARCLQELPLPLDQKFKMLSQLAFKGIVDKKFVFEECDVPEEAKQIGILVCEPEIESVVATRSKTYYFAHLTIQEFCAAYHISTCTTSQQRRIVIDYCNAPNFQQVMIYLSGICTNPAKIMKIICTRIRKSAEKCEDVLQLLQCAFESQSSEACTQLMKMLNSAIDLKGLSTVNSSIMWTVGYILANSEHNPKFKYKYFPELVLEGCNKGAVETLFIQVERTLMEKQRKALTLKKLE